MNRFKMKLSKCGCFLLCLSLILTIIAPITVSAEESEKKIVRVGLVGDNYNEVTEDGECICRRPSKSHRGRYERSCSKAGGYGYSCYDDAGIYKRII